MNNKEIFSSLRSDLPAGLVVFLVAMPLCLGIALASGAPIFSGIIAGIVGGILVGALSGSSVGVSGPAAGLVVIVFSAINDLGSFETFLFAVVLAGVIQLILGYLKAGVIGYYFPNNVIKGMLSGIGILIILKQIPHALGNDSDPEGDLAFKQADGHNTFSELWHMIESIDPSVITISAISLGILILWEQKFMKKIPVFNIIQGPLVAVLAGIGLHGSGLFSVSPEHLVSIPVTDSIEGVRKLFQNPDWSQWNNPMVYQVAFLIAIVASLETLLCVEATDKLDPSRRVTPTNRELKAQGLGNILSGLIGGLPITQVIVRSSANIQSGGKSKMSAIIHGVILLVAAFSIPGVINMIPLGSLAAVLLMVGYKLAKPSLFKSMYHQGRAQFVPFVVTVFGIIFTDLLIGIAMGMVVAILHILWKNLQLPYHFFPEDQKEGEPVRIQLAEEVSFLNKASILQTLNHLPDNVEVLIDASRNQFIHPDVQEIFQDFEVNAEGRNIEIRWIGSGLKQETDVVEDFATFIQRHKV